MPQRGNSEPVCQFPLTGAIVRTSEYDPADFDIACSLHAWNDAGNGPDCDRIVMVRGGEAIIQLRVRYRPDFEGLMTTFMQKTTVARVNDYICKQAVLLAGVSGAKSSSSPMAVVAPFVRSSPKVSSPGSSGFRAPVSPPSHPHSIIASSGRESDEKPLVTLEEKPAVVNEEKIGAPASSSENSVPASLDMSGYLIEESNTAVGGPVSPHVASESAGQQPIVDPFWSSWLGGSAPMQATNPPPPMSAVDRKADLVPDTSPGTSAQTPTQVQAALASPAQNRGSVAASYLAGWKQRGKERGMHSGSSPLAATPSPTSRTKAPTVNWFPESVTTSSQQPAGSSNHEVHVTTIPDQHAPLVPAESMPNQKLPSPHPDKQPHSPNSDEVKPSIVVHHQPSVVEVVEVPPATVPTPTALLDVPLPPPPWSPVVSQVLFVSSTLDDVATLFAQAWSSAKAQHHHSEVIAELEAASSNARHYARTCGDVTTVQQLPSVQMLGRLGAVADNLTLTSIGSDTLKSGLTRQIETITQVCSQLRKDGQDAASQPSLPFNRSQPKRRAPPPPALHLHTPVLPESAVVVSPQVVSVPTPSQRVDVDSGDAPSTNLFQDANYSDLSPLSRGSHPSPVKPALTPSGAITIAEVEPEAERLFVHSPAVVAVPQRSSVLEASVLEALLDLDYRRMTASSWSQMSDSVASVLSLGKSTECEPDSVAVGASVTSITHSEEFHRLLAQLTDKESSWSTKRHIAYKDAAVQHDEVPVAGEVGLDVGGETPATHDSTCSDEDVAKIAADVFASDGGEGVVSPAVGSGLQQLADGDKVPVVSGMVDGDHDRIDSASPHNVDASLGAAVPDATPALLPKVVSVPNGEAASLSTVEAVSPLHNLVDEVSLTPTAPSKVLQSFPRGPRLHPQSAVTLAVVQDGTSVSASTPKPSEGVSRTSPPSDVALPRPNAGIPRPVAPRPPPPSAPRMSVPRPAPPPPRPPPKPSTIPVENEVHAVEQVAPESISKQPVDSQDDAVEEPIVAAGDEVLQATAVKDTTPTVDMNMGQPLEFSAPRIGVSDSLAISDAPSTEPPDRSLSSGSVENDAPPTYPVPDEIVDTLLGVNRPDDPTKTVKIADAKAAVSSPAGPKSGIPRLVRKPPSNHAEPALSSASTPHSSAVNDIIGRVVKLSSGEEGIVRFLGSTEFASGSWVGVELFEPKGQHNGTVSGVHYFTCKLAPTELLSGDPKSPSTSHLFQDSGCYGVFVRPAQIELLSSDVRAVDVHSVSPESCRDGNDVELPSQRIRTEKGKIVKRSLSFAEQKLVEPAVYEWFAGLGFSEYLSSFYHAAVASLSASSRKKSSGPLSPCVLTMKWIAFVKRRDLVRIGVEKWHRTAMLKAITLLRESMTGFEVPDSDNPAVPTSTIDAERETPIGWATVSEDEKVGEPVELSPSVVHPSTVTPIKKSPGKKKIASKAPGGVSKKKSPKRVDAVVPAMHGPTASPPQSQNVFFASEVVDKPKKSGRSPSKRTVAPPVPTSGSSGYRPAVEPTPEGSRSTLAPSSQPPGKAGSVPDARLHASIAAASDPLSTRQASPKKWFPSFSLLEEGTLPALNPATQSAVPCVSEKPFRFRALAAVDAASLSEPKIDAVGGGKVQLQLPIPQMSQLAGLQQSLVVQRATVEAAEALTASLCIAESVPSHSPTARVQKLLENLETQARDSVLHEEMAKLSAWEASDTVDDWLTSLGCFQHSALFKACGINDLGDVCLLHEDHLKAMKLPVDDTTVLLNAVTALRRTVPLSVRNHP